MKEIKVKIIHAFGRESYWLIVSNNGYESRIQISEDQSKEFIDALKLSLVTNSGHEQIYSSKN